MHEWLYNENEEEQTKRERETTAHNTQRKAIQVCKF